MKNKTLAILIIALFLCSCTSTGKIIKPIKNQKNQYEKQETWAGQAEYRLFHPADIEVLSNNTILERNGFRFIEENGFYYVPLQMKNGPLLNVQFRYLPEELENVSVKDDELDKIRDFLFEDKEKESKENNALKKEIFITFDPEGTDLEDIAMASSDISMSFAQVFNIRPLAACTNAEVAACRGRPIKACNNDSKEFERNKYVVYIRHSNSPSITFENNCLVVEGLDGEMRKATSRLLMMWYGVV